MNVTKAIYEFNKGVLSLRIHWQLWVLLLVGVNGVAPALFIRNPESWIVLASTLVSAVLMVWLTSIYGFTRIVGLGHAAWIPMLVYLAPRLAEIPTSTPFGVWLRVVFVLCTISLVIDGIDVARFLYGDQRPLRSLSKESNR